LWAETRVALFQQSVDTRASGDHLRDRSPRVMFGTSWVPNSILDIYKEDIMRFRTLLSTTAKEDPLELLRKGKIPFLHALSMHNSTVYRWNRPCYGPSGKKPHLRIENRVLPAGPTVLDEMTNAALWCGLLNGLDSAYPDIRKVMDFDDAKANFLKACQNGLDSKFNWVKGKRITATELLQKELIPIAKEGLKKAKVKKADIDRYMDNLSARLENGQNGSNWALKSYAKLVCEKNTRETSIVTIVASTMAQQQQEIPVHKWELADLKFLADWQPSSIIVEEFMNRDLFTVRKDDIIELVAEIMNNEQLRYVPVENEEGGLEGLITSQSLLQHYYKQHMFNNLNKEVVLVEDMMITKPHTISPDASILEAIELMTANQVGSLPVVKNGKLVGIIVEQDFLNTTLRLMKNILSDKSK